MASGSIQKRQGKRGVRWTVVWDEPAPDGERKQRRKTFRTRKEAEAFQAKTITSMHDGSYVQPSTVTLAEHSERWLRSMAPTVKPATLDRYTRIMSTVVIPALGANRLATLQPVQIQDFYDAKLASGLAPATVKLYHGVLHRCLEAAVKWRIMPYNPAKAVDVPRPAPPEMKTWTAAEARRFLDAVADHELAAFWRLALMTGARRGELLALRWSDCDLDAGVISIRRTMSRGMDGVVFGKPKTAAGNRAIELDGETVDWLWRHKRRQNARRLECGEAWTDDDLAFDRGDGRYLHPNIVSHGFPKLCERAGVPRLRLHDVRHTSITLMLANGEPARLVQQRAGHADIAMTLGRYGHVLPGQDRDAVDRLARLLGS